VLVRARGGSGAREALGPLFGKKKKKKKKRKKKFVYKVLNKILFDTRLIKDLVFTPVHNGTETELRLYLKDAEKLS